MQQHSYSSWVAPIFVKWFTIDVGPKGFAGCGSGLGGCLVHSSVVDDLVDKTGLGENNFFADSLEVDAQKGEDVSFRFQSKIVASQERFQHGVLGS